MKVKCIKRYSDICLKEIVEKGTVLEVTENRGAHLISEGVAEMVSKAKAAAKGKEQVIQLSPGETQGEASYFLCLFPPGVKEADSTN